MPSILNLKFKGNKSFVAFSNLNDSEALTKTWKVCTKVASFLEQGQRLENLSWRLWHLQNLMVDTDNAKSKREFKKLSKCMGDKLDKEKGRSIEELEAPDYKRTPSSEMIRQRAAEKERYREQNAKPGTIKRMQFTFSVDQPSAPGANLPVKKPDLKPSPEFTKRTRAATRAQADDSSLVASTSSHTEPSSLKFDSIFNQGFGPSALLFPAPTLTTRMSYGEGLNPSNSPSDSFTVTRPTIELPLDEILNNVDSSLRDDPLPQQDVIMRSVPPATTTKRRTRKSSVATRDDGDSDDEVILDTTSFASVMKSYTPLSQAVKEPSSLPETVAPSKLNPLFSTSVTRTNPNTRPTLTVKTQTSSRSSGPGATATSLNPSSLRSGNTSGAPGGVKAECSNCGATHTPLWRRGLNDELNCNACGLYCKLHKRPRPKSMRNSHGGGGAGGSGGGGGGGGGGNNVGNTSSAAERPSTISNVNVVQSVTHGISGGNNSRPDTVDVLTSQTAQCYNCNTTATPLWRKDDEGKTVCNACGLYYKLHGSPRPISMKSDVIRKRSRHDARRGSNAASSAPGATINTTTPMEDTRSASPGISRRTSPIYDPPSPILAPDSSTTMTGPITAAANTTATLSYDYTQDSLTDAFGTTHSELVGALGQDQTSLFQNTFQFQYPGPYHPDYLLQMYSAHVQSVTSGGGNVASPDMGTVDLNSPSTSSSTNQQHHHLQQQHHHTTSPDDLDLPLMSPRMPKRRRMSIDSCIEEPPVSAVSWYSPESSSVALNGATGGTSAFPFGNTFATTTTTSGNGATSPGSGLGLIGVSNSSSSLHHHHHQQHHHHSLSHPSPSTSSHLLLHSSSSSSSSSSPPLSSSSSSSSHHHQQQQQQSQSSSHHHSHSLSHNSLSHHHHHSSSHHQQHHSHSHSGGPALRGSGNTFWHPPMMPLSDEQFHQQHQQQQQQQHNHLNNGLITSPYHHSSSLLPSSSSSSSSSTTSSVSSSSSSSSKGLSSSSSVMEMEEDSPMDYIHPSGGTTQNGTTTTSMSTGSGAGTATTVIQDDELFSAYLNHHPTPPPSEGIEVVV